MSFLQKFAVALAIFVTAAGPCKAVDIQEVVSDGGIKAWLVEEYAVPIIAIEIRFKGGASLDPADKNGRATLFAGLLDEGAGAYDATAFAEKEEETAVKLGFDATRDSFSVSATLLADRRHESLELLRLALHHPRFDSDAVARVKQQLISGIRQNEANPDKIASKAFFARVFPDDPYGRTTNGTEATVADITAEDLRDARALYLSRTAMSVGVVGAISAKALKPVLDQLLAKLPMVRRDALDDAQWQAEPGVTVVDNEAPQSVVIFGHEGIKRSDPDFIPAFVMNDVLGGGRFESRLMTEIRAKRGLAYGAYSYLTPLDRAGLYIGGFGTRNDAVAESIELVRQEWSKLAAEGLSEDDLDRAKKYLTGAYPLRFDSNAKIARFLAGVQAENLGIDYINQRNGMVESVTVDDIKRVAKRLLKPESLFFVVVGQPDRL
jgi:zinc protease